MMLYALYAVVAILILAIGRALSGPNAFRIERSAKVNALPDRIAPHIADFHQWATWSPWEKLDPSLQRTYSGTMSGTGAVYEWQGNNKVGAGRMEITDASADRVLINLDFLRPFKASNKTEFRLSPASDGTNVSWIMTGDRPALLKIFGMFMNMDKTVGGDFEKGLAGLKQVAEQPVTR